MSRRLVLLTGCSGGGKSTLLRALEKRGFATVEEPGRRIVSDELAGCGKALQWVNMKAFAQRAVEMARSDLRSAQDMDGLGDQEYYGYRSDLYGDVCRAFERHDIPVNDQTIQLHQGLFEDTLADFPDTPIAFAHIDCDWYDPVKLCLEQTHHRSVAGTIMLIDDYHDYEGCKTATDEFLAAHPEYELEMGPNVALIKNA